MPDDILHGFNVLVSNERLPGDKVRAAFYDRTKGAAPEIEEEAFRIVNRHYPEVADQIREELEQARG